MIEEATAAIDHIAARVSASAMTGLGCGAAYGTYKGFPIFKTSMSTAFSFALVSTACFGMERLANVILLQSTNLIESNKDVVGDNTSPIIRVRVDGKSIESNPDVDVGDNTSSIIQPTINPRLHYGSHALGGLVGGSVVGFLFQGKSLAGALLFTPIMMGIGKMEVSLDAYRAKRLQQLLEDIDNEQEETGA